MNAGGLRLSNVANEIANCQSRARSCEEIAEKAVEASTYDMALDACEPSMEGMSCGIEYGACQECCGMGEIEDESVGADQDTTP